MADLVVIVPSRGRPEAVAELSQAFSTTCTAGTELVLAIDSDDPQRVGYYRLLNGETRVSKIMERRAGNMVSALNMAAVEAASLLHFAIGFMGDDHRPRTQGWDKDYLDALRELRTGIVYGNDLLQGRNIPTQVAMTSDIVRALGHMAPPTLTHLFVDNYWRDLGLAGDCLRYLPEVVVEHMHPVAGKSEWTEGHQRVNAPEMYRRDREAYTAYRQGLFWKDVAAVKTLRGAS